MIETICVTLMDCLIRILIVIGIFLATYAVYLYSKED